jgi:hypothetical protein
MTGPARNVITIVPVGPGEPRKLTIPVEPVGALNWRWFPDGKRLIVTGNEPGRPRRSYEYVIDYGEDATADTGRDHRHA